MLTKDKVQLLIQLVQALNEAVEQMEKAKDYKRPEDFEKYKKIAKDIQNKIGEAMKQ